MGRLNRVKSDLIQIIIHFWQLICARPRPKSNPTWTGFQFFAIVLLKLFPQKIERLQGLVCRVGEEAQLLELDRGLGLHMAHEEHEDVGECHANG